MSTPHSAARLLIFAIAGSATICCGCTSLSDVSLPLIGPLAHKADPETDRQAWWKANQHRKVFVPGKGYAVEGTPGYFDENGHPIGGGIKSITEGTYSTGEGPKQIGKGAQQVSSAESQPSAENSSGFSWEKLKPNVLFATLKSAVGQSSGEQRAQALVEEGDTLFRKQEFAAAAKKFETAIKRSTDPVLRQEAIFKQGESYFFADEYPKANDAYNALFKEFPASRNLDKAIDRQFAIGRYWQQYQEARPHWPITPNLLDKTRYHFDTQGHALKVFENIRLNDPTGPRADDALMATANTYFKQGRYEQADYHYGLLRREYPKSEHQFEAHLLGLQAKLRRYQGPNYDGTVLDEADKLVKQLLTQFPGRVRAERERIENIRAEIAAQRALRDWTIAEYYAKRSQYGAARFYYGQILSNYPETQLARQSRDRLAQYKSEPDIPPVKIAWLVDAFSSGSSGKRKIAVAATPQGSGTRR